VYSAGMTTICVRSPADGSLVGEVSTSSSEEIHARVARASAAAEKWRRTPLRERARAMRRLRTEVLKARSRIAELIAREQGKPLLEAYLAEVFPCIDHLTFLILDGPRILAPRRARHAQPFLAARKAHYVFQPYGVWALISPWNYPFVIPFLQAATLVFAGNGVVVKPSPFTPLSGALVKDLFQAAGFPEGLVEVVHGGAVEGEALVRSNGIRAVLFTGGPEGGRKVLAAAADGLKKVVLELGGKDAALVLDDAPLERAAKGIAWAAMFNAGQTCASVERVLVEKPASARFKELLAAEVSALRVGHPLQAGVDIGPLTAAFQLERVKAQVDAARKGGARISAGGETRHDLGPLYYAPTVVEEPPGGSTLLREETFGPVVAVQTVDSLDSAVRAANDAEYGLTTSIWTRDKRRARALIPEIQCGVVTVNSHLASYGEPRSAWGGFGPSGFGRTHGEFGLLEAAQVQYVDEGYSEKHDLWWYPATERVRDIVERTFELIADPSAVSRARALLKLLPHSAYLARRAPTVRMLPAFLRYFR